MATDLGFFKFFFLDTSGEQLEIPPSFAQSVKGRLPEKVVLKDRYNNTWQVKVANAGKNKLSFAEGWPEFVRETCIKEEDLIIFRYSSEGLFDIKIFGPSACETEGVGGPRVEEEENVLPSEENEASNDIDVSDYEMEMEEEEEEEVEVHVDTNSTRKSKQENDPDSVGKQSQRNRRVLSDIYGSEIFLSGLAPHPTNPYFVTKINPRRRSEFYIPKQLMRHGNIELAEKIIFEDPSRRQWIGNRQTWNNSRVFYTKGWRPLCECNSVQDDDLCICEFTKDEDGTNFINVSFVRGGY